MNTSQSEEEIISLKSYFYPLTSVKAIYFIVIIGLIVYFNSLFNGFVWDDLSNIVFNPQVRSLNVNNIFGTGIVNSGLQYRPVVNFYFSFMYAVFRDTPFPYHFLNIVFHIINSVLVFLLFRKFISLNIAFFLTLIFLVHPMQVESAAWIATSGNFYFLFGLSALLLSMKDKLSIKRLTGIALCVVLSLASKETGILFVGMMFLYSLIYKKNNLKILMLTNGITVVLYLFMRIGIAKIYFDAPSTIIPIAGLPLAQRLLNIPAMLFFYLKTFFYPVQLVIMQYWVVTSMDYEHFFLPLVIDLIAFSLVGVLGLFIFTKNKKLFPAFLFFFILFVVGLLLHMQISPLNMTVADRWFYSSMVGLLGIVGLALQLLFEKYKKRTNVFLLVGGFTVLLLLATRTIVRNADWRNDLTLYMHDRKILTNFNIENNIGWNYQNQMNFKEAQKYYKNSVDIYPYYAISLNNLAYAYEMLGDKKRARLYFYKVFQATDYYPELYNRDIAFTGWALLRYDSLNTTKDFIVKALKKSPQNAPLWAYLAVCNYKLHDQKAALINIEKAESFSINPLIKDLHVLIENNEPIPENLNIISE
jgi:hypothetical protein